MLKKIRQGLANHQPLRNSQMRKRASVLIPLLEKNGVVSVLLTKRSQHLRSHAGQVSFPGGKQDETDVNSLETALREANEEIGLAPENVEVIGRLDQILSLHSYLVTPYVCIIPNDYQPDPNPEEIESVFQVPLTFFMTDTSHWTEEYETERAWILAHHFEYERYDIWGLTSKLILRLLDIGLDFVPDYPVHHPASPTWMELTADYIED